jgi:hypothetical protein
MSIILIISSTVMVDNIINYNGTNIPPPKSQKKKKKYKTNKTTIFIGTVLPVNTTKYLQRLGSIEKHQITN